MTHISDNERRSLGAEIASRRRALTVNSNIYSRRHGPRLLPVLDGQPIRARYVAEMAWLASESRWQTEDARRVSDLANAIAACGGLRPEATSLCDWHSARLHELVRQHEAAARLEAEHRRASAWPAVPQRSSNPPKRGRSSRKSTGAHR